MTELPEPDAVSLEHSTRLRQLLRERIDAVGPIPFARYMEYVLYEPGFGYYMAGATKFGDAGDFITAPEVSPLFGAALANEVRGVLRRQGGEILELGAGSGKLASSMVQALQDVDDLRYTILEPSAELVERQRELLEDQLDKSLFRKLQWIDSLPSTFRGVVVANEVMDALPVERFVQAEQLQQVFVGADLAAMTRPADDSLVRAVAAIEGDLGQSLAPGYCSEICLLLNPWVASLSQMLDTGVILLIDYGYPRREYYLPERCQGTLACYYRHRSHDDPFKWPGLQDITAHVDFTSVAEAAVSHGLELLGYASQSAFLLDNDLLPLAERLTGSVKRERDRIAVAKAVKTLTLPGEMGERFQVMALGRGYDHPLHGFRTQDFSYRL
ncbi:MAG: SAM-dependent methyltransferase [Granulosicoccus sp.]|nr:SAM-dependent methyltransferase [Granulosicoccus sp.]